MHFNDTLYKLGFSPIEATVFMTLCKHGSLTGYEASKLTGISRSNVYAALYSLQDKGKCFASEGEPTKYIPITKEELLLTTKREMEQTLSEIESYFPRPVVTNEPYLTIRGYEHVIHKIKNHILLCESHLYIMSTLSDISLLQDELIQISSTHKVIVMCDAPLDLGEHIKSYVHTRPIEGFYMIIDTKSVITGDLNGEDSQCLYSTNESLVHLMRSSFKTALDMINLQA